MIGKQFKRDSFARVLNYVAGKDGASFITGSMGSRSVAELVAEFERSHDLKPDLKKPVYHASLSCPHDEHLDDDTWKLVAIDYMAGMGFENCQWVAYRHVDRDHDHIHFIASRIEIDSGKVVSDSWNYYRSQDLIRELEKQYELTEVPSSWEVEDRAISRGEKEKLERTGELSIRQRLQQSLSQIAEESETMPDFIGQALQLGICIELAETPAGSTGITYTLDGITLSGSQLGRGYTFTGLQKWKGLDYQLERDDLEIERILHPSAPYDETETVTPSAPHPQPQTITYEEWLAIAARYFNRQAKAKQAKVDGQMTTVEWNGYVFEYQKPEPGQAGVFLVKATDGRGVLARSLQRDDEIQNEFSDDLQANDAGRMIWLRDWMKEADRPSVSQQQKMVNRRKQQELEL